MRIFSLIQTGALVLSSNALLSAAPIISEFMASNDSGLADEDGDFSDWIEIHNPAATVLDLEGYSLTDDATKLTRWEFPAVSLEAGAYLVVFASNKNRSDPSDQLHTNFKLSAAGGYLALSGPDGIVSEFGPVYSTQFEDQSYGVGTFGSVTQETLVEAGDAVNYLIPEDGVLGTTWTAEAFDDATWANC